MKQRHIFTRKEIEAYFKSVYCTDLADDERVSIDGIARFKGILPATWVVEYTSHTGHGMHYSNFHNKSIIMAGHDYHGNAQLRIAETVILPEEIQEEAQPKGEIGQ